MIPLADGVTPSKKKLRVANQSSTSASGVNMITPVRTPCVPPPPLIVYILLQFKPMKIPDSWRNNPKVLRQAVLDAVNNCKYGNDHKKSQLAQAVLEAVGGKQTMKAAALMYDVPFTTLQTYFHRARVVIVRMLGKYTVLAFAMNTIQVTTLALDGTDRRRRRAPRAAVTRPSSMTPAAKFYRRPSAR